MLYWPGGAGTPELDNLPIIVVSYAVDSGIPGLTLTGVNLVVRA
jgi:hypothetical protein